MLRQSLKSQPPEAFDQFKRRVRPRYRPMRTDATRPDR